MQTAIAEKKPAALPDGPLPWLLLLLTLLTGIVDAVSYLRLGHVFVANMTGNIVFLGFAVADPASFSILTSIVAVGGFLAGAVGGGRIANLRREHRGRMLAMGITVEFVLLAIALFGTLSLPASGPVEAPYAVVFPLAAAMGLQTSLARRLAVADMPTSVLTLTLTGIASDSSLAGNPVQNLPRRLLAVFSMFTGGAIGAVLVLMSGMWQALAAGLLVLAAAGGICGFASRKAAPWAGPGK